MRERDFPPVQEIANWLAHIPAQVDPDYKDGEWDVAHIDVRLQVWSDGSWTMHSGDSQYDQDGRGYWGSGCVTADDTPESLFTLAKELRDEAIEAAYENDDFNESESEEG